MSDSSNRNPNTNCAICDKAIYVKPYMQRQAKRGMVFCSKVCYGLSCRVPEKICPVCKVNPILQKRRAKNCSRECANIGRTGTKYTGEQLNSNVTKLNKLKKSLIERSGSRCEVCQYDNLNILQVHHILERKNGGTDELSNLKLLCPNCHAEVHHGDSRKSHPIVGVGTCLENNGP